MIRPSLPNIISSLEAFGSVLELQGQLTDSNWERVGYWLEQLHSVGPKQYAPYRDFFVGRHPRAFAFQQTFLSFEESTSGAALQRATAVVLQGAGAVKTADSVPTLSTITSSLDAFQSVLEAGGAIERWDHVLYWLRALHTADRPKYPPYRDFFVERHPSRSAFAKDLLAFEGGGTSHGNSQVHRGSVRHGQQHHHAHLFRHRGEDSTLVGGMAFASPAAVELGVEAFAML